MEFFYGGSTLKVLCCVRPAARKNHFLMNVLSQIVDDFIPTSVTGPFELLCKNVEDTGTVMTAGQVTSF